MRKDIRAVLITAVVLALAGSFAARDASAELTYEIGFKSGYNTTKIKGGDVETFAGFDDPGIDAEGNVDDFKPGFVGGVFFRFQFTKLVGVQLETIYSQKGSKGNISGYLDIPPEYIPFDFESTFTFFYFEVPLLAVFSLPATDFLTFNAMAGPVIGYCSKAELKFEGTVYGYPAGQRSDIDEITKGVDFGGVFAGGFAVDIGRINILLESRWTLGLTSIDDSGGNLDVKNSAFSFMIGLGVPIGGGE